MRERKPNQSEERERARDKARLVSEIVRERERGERERERERQSIKVWEVEVPRLFPGMALFGPKRAKSVIIPPCPLASSRKCV